MNLHTLLETDLTKLVTFKTEQHKEDFMIEFSDMFFERLIERAYDLLSDEDDTRLEKLIDEGGTQTQVFAFFAETIPEFTGIVGEVFLDQRQEAVEILTAITT